jgi:hypothetical protein
MYHNNRHNYTVTCITIIDTNILNNYTNNTYICDTYMNSVMDDNKMLTLASNERIPLKHYMRMVFEIRDLKYATPATVSRAGTILVSMYYLY